MRGHRRRVLYEDALKHLYNCEIDGHSPTLQSLAGQLNSSIDATARVVSSLEGKRLLEFKGEVFELTKKGREYAVHVVRAHRLWEAYLAEETGLAEIEWHGQAERQEHKLSPAQADELAAQLGNPKYDPHGDPIPQTAGTAKAAVGISALRMESGDKGRIVHLEDEPESVYARLVQLRIHRGMEIQVLSRTGETLSFLIEDRKIELDSVAAANITVEPVEDEGTDFSSVRRLSELHPGDQGEVVIVSRAARAVERRRFMDLGILPGTIVEAELTGPGGDPSAYRIRGALIALRREQADHIFVNPVQRTAA
jgi:DtxR family Mn-dependent transcriptional regulator